MKSKRLVWPLLLILLISCNQKDSYFTMNDENAQSNKDTTSPVITLIGSNSLTIVIDEVYSDLGATALDNIDGDISANLIILGQNIDTSVAGIYNITYNITDTAANSATQITRTVNVVDNVIPTITLIGNLTLNIEYGSVYSDTGATANDNLDGNITPNIVVGGDNVDTNSLGAYTITYNVNDAAANSAVQVTRTINVVDTTIPVITAPDISIDLLNVNSWIDDVSATDNADGDLTGSIVTTGDIVDQTVEGSYTITYNVTDSSSNNAVQVIRTVTVVYCTVARINSFPYANSQSIPVGNGTTTPYAICSLYQLLRVNNGLASNFDLKTNIDASSAANWIPLGSYTTPYTGTFNGNGYKVSNITINSSELTSGFFGTIENSTIKNLGLANIDVTATNTAGGLVGAVKINCLIQNSYVTGTVNSSSSYAGGLIGVFGNYEGTSTLKYSYSTANVSGTNDNIGGLTGLNHSNGTISNCYATGNVSSNGGNEVGGLVGTNYGTISNSYATGDVSSSGIYVGGLLGFNSKSSIVNSFATGSINLCTSLCGGFNGYYTAGSNNYRFFDHFKDTSAGTLVFDLSDFYDSSRDPFLDNWDFSTIWEEHTDTYPTLLNMPN